MRPKKLNSPVGSSLNLPLQDKSVLRTNLGNALIIISLVVLLNLYLPIIMLYLPNTQAAENIKGANYIISIQKINALAPVIDDVDAWDPAIYKKALEKGVASAKTFADPGQSGTIFLFAHSSDSPFRQTKYNTVFFRLGELASGDLITLKKDGQEFKYKVTEKKEVWPNEVEHLLKTEGDTLIIQTCTPVGTSLRRLLVFAKPI